MLVNDSCPLPENCCGLVSSIHHLFTRGIVMLLSGIIAVSVPVIMTIKDRRAAIEAAKIINRFARSKLSQGQIDELDFHHDTPFETLGFDLLGKTRMSNAVKTLEIWPGVNQGQREHSCLHCLHPYRFLLLWIQPIVSCDAQDILNQRCHFG